MSKLKKLSIGFVGYSGQKFDEDMANRIIKEFFDDWSHIMNKDVDIEIVSGLTNIGIPKLVYEAAKERGYKTVGIACEKAKDYECFPCDEEIIIGKEWGDESDNFLNRITMLVKIGGGKQSEAELTKALKMHKIVIEFPLEAIK